MAGDQDDSQKTEEPTEQRLKQAQEKGDVAKSPEVTAVALLLVATGLLAGTSGFIADLVAGRLRPFIERPHDIVLDGTAILSLFANSAVTLLLGLAIPFAALMVAAVVGNLIQHPPVFTTEKMKPDLKKISPLGGAKRMFGLQGWVNLGKGVAKILIISALVIVILWPDRDLLPMMMEQTPGQMLLIMRDKTVYVLAACCAVLTVIAALDLSYQKMERHKRLRMSRQDLKDEFKQSEGDPHVKGRLKQIRMERGKQRMMAAVPEATVVVANPVHFAVALKYESDTMQAPVCVAKGVDAMAVRIREIAKEHSVTVVENPPLARALYASVEVDEPVPPEHFKAVAQVIAYVWRLRARKPSRK